MFDYIWQLTFPPLENDDMLWVSHDPAPLWDDDFADTHAAANPGYTILD